MTPIGAILLLLGAIGALLLLVLWLRLHPLLALLTVSASFAVIGGIPLVEVAAHMQEAMGGVLGYIAVVIGLGAIFGQMLERSGGAQRIAEGLLSTLGPSRGPTAFGLAGLLVAIPVFFDVAFILMLPMLRHAARQQRRPVLAFALPLLAGLAVAHAFIPPTPGPVAVAGLIGADLGWVIGLGLLVGLPCLVVSGLVVGQRLGDAFLVEEGANDTARDMAPELELPNIPAKELPSFGLSLGLILLPTGFILLATASKVWLQPGTGRDALQFLGHPFIALLITCLAATWWLGRHCGWSRAELEKMANRSLLPVGAILLITGAGGVLGKVLLASGAGNVLAEMLQGSGLPIHLLAFLLALVMRLAQGSATVSMVTAAGLLAPILEHLSMTTPHLALLVLAIASGATACSHVNDSGFWLVGRYLHLDPKQTLRTWTVVTLCIGGTGLATVLLLAAVL